MKSLNKFDRLNAPSNLIAQKQKFGALYGMIAGLSFAVSSWGWDGYVMSKTHAYFPWTALMIGAVLCAILGGIVGWLTARADSSLFGTIFWIVSSLFFAWLMVALPLQIAPLVVSKLDPQLGALLNYDQGLQFTSRFGVSLMWIIPFTLIVGVTQLPVTETAVFSTSFFGRVTPFFFCIIVMGFSGVFTDNLINEHFRTAVISLDTTIQFVVDNKNNENADPARSRELHARAFRDVEEYVQESRHLLVRSYDETLGDLQVLVKFDSKWVDCNVLYSQPISCEIAAGK